MERAQANRPYLAHVLGKYHALTADGIAVSDANVVTTVDGPAVNGGVGFIGALGGNGGSGEQGERQSGTNRTRELDHVGISWLAVAFHWYPSCEAAYSTIVSQPLLHHLFSDTSISEQRSAASYSG